VKSSSFSPVPPPLWFLPKRFNLRRRPEFLLGGLSKEIFLVLSYLPKTEDPTFLRAMPEQVNKVPFWPYLFRLTARKNLSRTTRLLFPSLSPWSLFSPYSSVFLRRIIRRRRPPNFRSLVAPPVSTRGSFGTFPLSLSLVAWMSCFIPRRLGCPPSLLPRRIPFRCLPSHPLQEIVPCPSFSPHPPPSQTFLTRNFPLKRRIHLYPTPLILS